MKRFSIISFILCLVVSEAYGQEFGVNFGLNYFNIREVFVPSRGSCCKTNTSDDLNYENVLNLNFGGHVKFRLNQNFSIFGELQFSQKGFMADSIPRPSGITALDRFFKRRLTLNYLEAPIAMRYQLKKKRAITPYVQTGVYFSYLLGGKYQLENDFRPSNSTDFQDLVSKFDWGLMIGTGLDYKDFSLELNFLSSVQNISADLEGLDIRRKNKGLKLTVRYWL